MTPKFNQTFQNIQTMLESGSSVSKDIRVKHINNKIDKIKRMMTELTDKWSHYTNLLEQSDDLGETLKIKRKIKQIELKNNNLQEILNILQDTAFIDKMLNASTEDYISWTNKLSWDIRGTNTSNYVPIPETLKKRNISIKKIQSKIRNSAKVKPTGKKIPWTTDEKYQLYQRYTELIKNFPNKHNYEITLILADEFHRSYSSIKSAIVRLIMAERNNDPIY